MKYIFLILLSKNYN